MCPKSQQLLGLNVNRGTRILIRLRYRTSENECFLPYHQVLDTMLHEVAHNVFSDHSANFYDLWNELRVECRDSLELRKVLKNCVRPFNGKLVIARTFCGSSERQRRRNLVLQAVDKRTEKKRSSNLVVDLTIDTNSCNVIDLT